jgi:hypothetical protein
MLGMEIFDSSDAGTTRQMVERRVPFPQSDGMFVRNMGKEFAEAPDSALVEIVARGTTFEPERFQRSGIRRGGSPTGEAKFKKIAANRAAKIFAGGVRMVAAGDAT